MERPSYCGLPFLSGPTALFLDIMQSDQHSLAALTRCHLDQSHKLKRANHVHNFVARGSEKSCPHYEKKRNIYGL